MPRLYAVGETCCNGVHGTNRLASNSLLESLVFAKRAAISITAGYVPANKEADCVDMKEYADAEKLFAEYKRMLKKAIEEAENANKRD